MTVVLADAAASSPNPLGVLTFVLCVLSAFVGLPLLAFLGYSSAPFGKAIAGRGWSVLHLGVMLSLLGGECFVFQVVCWPGLRYVILFDLLAALTTWSFLRVALTDPGTAASPEWQAWSSTSQAAHAQRSLPPLKPQEDSPVEQCLIGGRPWCTRSSDAEEVQLLRRASSCWAPGEVSLCARCDQLRPERAHHCRHCGVCVLRLDHHCALVGNCIGWRNHKYFLLLLWWQFWACLVFLLTPEGPAAHALFIGLSARSIREALALQLSVAWASILLVISLKSFADNALNASRDQTCIEAHLVGENPYAKSGRLLNLKQLLGAFDLRLLLPLEPMGQARGGGTCFEAAPPSPALGAA